ncbi:TRAP transporter permease [Suttonella sp. R2A3]|uniref:TRAP transporter permease n=1 Tax=Suttonella sp. R2A3 TaxID=2908648 RepID=UPI001F2CB346|nr:TRAP transporter permease [Suttonella sp. R2A3]UJF24325.1 TRAP transporter permease [Suttonella sp. R2A3]
MTSNATNPFLIADSGNHHLSRVLLIAFNTIALILAIFSITNAFYPLVSELQRNIIHFIGFAALAVMYYPLHVVNYRWRSQWLDLMLGLGMVVAAAWFMGIEDQVYVRQSAQEAMFSTLDWVFAVILLLGTLELTRRTTGWVIPILIVLSVSYISWLGELLPGVFRFAGLSPETVLFRSIYGDDALFGSIASISSTYVFLFIIFGAFLLRSGAGDFVVDLARGIAGRFIGGPGWVAVIASGLTGTISGSAVANTASTGVITIPLMQRAGFPSKFAAGVEASASTGGQIMPPIMGAGAFVMASYTLIPYEHIVAVAFLPAILYFLSVAMFVRIEAKKQGLKPVSEANVKPLSQTLKDQGASFIIPIVVLITLLIKGYTPTYAAVIGIMTIIAASWLTKTKMGLSACLEALINGSKNMVMMGVLLCAVGLIVNVISTTGIGNTFSLMISSWADGNLLVAIVLVALASLILGMGLPVTAAYIVLATLSAPALTAMMLDSQLVQMIADGALPESVAPLLMLADPSIASAISAPMPIAEAQTLFDSVPEELRFMLRDQAVDPTVAQTALLSAHMIVFWLSQDSNVTPPVCLASFTAATIAKTPPMATGFESWKLAKGMYIMPVLFAYTPFLSGDWVASLLIFTFGCFGVYALAAAMQGAMERRIGWIYRALLAACGVAMLWPNDIARIVGLAAFVVLFILQFRLGQKPSLT